MSYGICSIPGPSGQADIQKKLHSLLQHLSWSYVALWSFNPQSRILEWTGGHFRGDSTDQSDTEGWNGHLFNMQKACIFTPGQGSVGMAYAERRNIWVNGQSVHRSAGSGVQAQFLKHARIETAVYIPWAESVLELGACESVAEDIDLMDSIYVFMGEDILPALGHAQAPPHVSQSPLAATGRSMTQSSPFPLLRHESDEFLSQDFELNDQTRRTSSLNTDMFLQHPDEGEEELGNTSNVPKEPRWRSSPTTSRPTDMLQTQKPPLPAATNQALMRFQAYRSHSGTTSSSLSSLEDSSVKLSVDSPEQSISLMASSSHRHNSHSYASSSARRETPSHSPEIQLGDTTGIAAPPQHLHDFQQAIKHMLDEGEPQEPWPQMYMDPFLETGNLPDSAFEGWRHTHVLQRREGSTNQGLLRRCFEIMRQIPNLQQSNEPLHGAPVQNLGHHLTSSSSPEGRPEHDPFDQAEPSREQRRPRGRARIGSPGSVHEEASKHHMMAERHRRMKQKENFTALRKLVPIISKNDKASILGDAIIYLKDLQAQIQDMQADRTEMQSRYEKLKLSHQELQERNKQLEAMVAATSSGGASPVLPPP